GGGLAVHEEARIDDQLLHLYSLEVRRWWQLLLLIPALLLGSFRQTRYARALQGSSFEIVTRRPRSINTDGEITTATPARFDVVPRALAVFVPAAEAEQQAEGARRAQTVP